MTLPVVAVVGRPNVGKSTLVNRFLGRREAIVEQHPGVTRDRVLYRAEWLMRPFLLVDTGGLEARPEAPLAEKVGEVARAAAAEADVIVFVVDVVQGITPEDRDLAGVLRKLGRRVVLVANKADNPAREQVAAEAYELGFGEVHAVSALHGRAIGDLLDDLTAGFADTEPPEQQESGIAIVGRPNVGKSSLYNRLVGSERSIVHTDPGTTRDAVDTLIEADGELLRLVDTAGLRRATRVDASTEYYSTVRTMRALDRSEVAVLVVDTEEGINRQDLRIAEQIIELGRSAIVLLNKADLLSPEERRERETQARRRLPHLDFAPFISASAVTGMGVDQLIPAVRRILDARALRVPTHLLNAVVDELQGRTPVPSRTRNIRVKYAVQAEVAPPTVVLFGAGDVPDPWLRYLDRGLRRRFGFEGTPIRFVLRGGDARSGDRSGSRGARRARR